jgi:hypothetical protein
MRPWSCTCQYLLCSMGLDGFKPYQSEAVQHTQQLWPNLWAPQSHPQPTVNANCKCQQQAMQSRNVCGGVR